MKKRYSYFSYMLYLLLTCIPGKAQFSIYASGTYGFPLAKQMIVSDMNIGSTGFYVFKGLEGSLGKGFSTGIGMSYRLSNCFSVETGLEKLYGSKLNSSFTDTLNYNRTIERVVYGKMLNVIPGLRFTGGEKKLKFYMRTGLLIGLGGKMFSEKTEFHYTALNGVAKSKQVFSGGAAWGFLAGAGVDYSLNKWISFLAEISVHAQTWSPLKSRLTECTSNGNDQLYTMPVSQKEFEYAHDLSPSAQSADSPSVYQRVAYPFSSWGITLGVRLKFEDFKTSAIRLTDH